MKNHAKKHNIRHALNIHASVHLECEEVGVSKKLAKWEVVVVVSNELWTEMRDGLCTCRAAHSQMCADKGRGKGR